MSLQALHFYLQAPDLHLVWTPRRRFCRNFRGSSFDGVYNSSSVTSTPSSQPVKLPQDNPDKKSLQQSITLIIRKDLLDDSNAAKDLTDDVKKRLKILLRPGEPEKRPDLTWPKSMKKEPVEVVKVLMIPKKMESLVFESIILILQEVIDLLNSFRETMRRNYEILDVEKIQERW